MDVFAFDGPPAPPPPGPISKRGATEYPQWVRDVTETHDVRATDLGLLRIWLMDERRKRMPATPYRLQIGPMIREGLSSADGLVEEHGLELAETAILGWGMLAPDDPQHGLLDYRYEREVHTLLAPEKGSDEHVLHNLAYTTDTVENRMIVFEADYETPRTLLHQVHRDGKSAPDATERKR